MVFRGLAQSTAHSSVRAPMSGVLRAPRNPLRQGALALHQRIAAAIFVFLHYGGLGVDGVPAARQYQAIAPPFGRHSHASPEFRPRRPLPRQTRFDDAKNRLRYRSTANPSALTRLLCRIRHSSLLLGQLPVFRGRQTVLPYVGGDTNTYRLRRTQGREGSGFTYRLRRLRVGRHAHGHLRHADCARN